MCTNNYNIDTLHRRAQFNPPRRVNLDEPQTTGRILEDVDHIIKVIGFDGDFGVDRVMKTEYHLGHWPNGDTRRFVCSDMSAIDASRFGGIALSPFSLSVGIICTWYFQHPADAYTAINSGMFSPNYANPEKGKPSESKQRLA